MNANKSVSFDEGSKSQISQIHYKSHSSKSLSQQVHDIDNKQSIKQD